MTRETKNGRAGSEVARTEGRPEEVTLLSWKTSLRQRRPKTFAMGILASALGLGLVWVGFPGEWNFLVLAAMMLVGALGSLYFPTRYTFSNQKVYQQVLSSKDSYPWRDFDSYRVDSDGVYLHLEPRDLRLRYLKGVMVYFSPTNRDEVLDVVRRHLSVSMRGDTSNPDGDSQPPGQKPDAR